MMNEADLQNQMAQLFERIEQLEQRVEILEKGGSRAIITSAGEGVAASVGTAAGEELAEAIRMAMTTLGEGDAGAIRQQMVKNGQPATLGRSDVNKMLYNRKDLFKIDRQEGAKPIWKLLA